MENFINHYLFLSLMPTKRTYQNGLDDGLGLGLEALLPLDFSRVLPTFDLFVANLIIGSTGIEKSQTEPKDSPEKIPLIESIEPDLSTIGILSNDSFVEREPSLSSLFSFPYVTDTYLTGMCNGYIKGLTEFVQRQEIPVETVLSLYNIHASGSVETAAAVKQAFSTQGTYNGFCTGLTREQPQSKTDLDAFMNPIVSAWRLGFAVSIARDTDVVLPPAEVPSTQTQYISFMRGLRGEDKELPYFRATPTIPTRRISEIDNDSPCGTRLDLLTIILPEGLYSRTTPRPLGTDVDDGSLPYKWKTITPLREEEKDYPHVPPRIPLSHMLIETIYNPKKECNIDNPQKNIFLDGIRDIEPNQSYVTRVGILSSFSEEKPFALSPNEIREFAQTLKCSLMYTVGRRCYDAMQAQSAQSTP